MKRRDFLAAGFKLGAAGLLLPFIEPARKVWALDRTMVPRPNPFAGKVVIGGWEPDDTDITDITEYWDTIHVTNTSHFERGDVIYVGSEPMLVTGVFDTTTMRVIRNFGRP